jgi:hypothetical protein
MQDGDTDVSQVLAGFLDKHITNDNTVTCSVGRLRTQRGVRAQHTDVCRALDAAGSSEMVLHKR